VATSEWRVSPERRESEVTKSARTKPIRSGANHWQIKVYDNPRRNRASRTNPVSGRSLWDASHAEMIRLSRATPSAERDLIGRTACFLSLLAQAAAWLRELRESRQI
jgi:hypothetical protein